MAKIKQNSPVLFYFNQSKKWLVKISKKESLHTHIGVIKHADAIGKDIGYIIARAGIGSGQKILEIGTGSGSLTSFVASVVKPRGHVYTFDVDENFMKIAEKNIKKAGMSKYVTQQNLDLKTAKKMPLEEADVALIDLGDPWTVLPQVRKMLKGSGAVFAICPTMNQLEKLTMALVENEFTDIESTEHIIRTIEAREGKTRHSFQGIGHTTYLCYARKAFFGRVSKKKSDSSSYPESEHNIESDTKST